MKLQSIAIFLTAASIGFAQGPHGQPVSSQRLGLGLDMNQVQTIEGAVTAVNIAYGSQYPSIQINQTTIKIAPIWYLLENAFEIKVGDTLKVIAAPALDPRDPYLCAISITNTLNESLTLRDSNGVPLWTQPARGAGRTMVRTQKPGAGQQGTGIRACALSSITTVTGIVQQVTAGVGIQMPTVVLSADGKLLTIKIGPERILQAADFEIKAGDTLTVKYGVTCTNELVALALTDDDGVTLVLRDADGTPAW